MVASPPSARSSRVESRSAGRVVTGGLLWTGGTILSCLARQFIAGKGIPFNSSKPGLNPVWIVFERAVTPALKCRAKHMRVRPKSMSEPSATFSNRSETMSETFDTSFPPNQLYFFLFCPSKDSNFLFCLSSFLCERIFIYFCYESYHSLFAYDYHRI